MILLSSLGLRPSKAAASVTIPTDAVTVANFSRDRTLFDSGAAFGRAVADIPLSGSGTAGRTVEARAVSTDDGGASGTAWAEIGIVGENGTWSGTISVPRGASWFRAQVRVKESPHVVAQTANRFGVGHVFAIWGQSEVERIASTFYDNTAAPAVADDEAVQIFLGAASVPSRHLVTTAAPYSAGVAALADTLIAARPGEKFAIVFQAVAGTDPRALVNDSDPDRMWSADKALHDFACADGQHVGIAAMSWFASPRGLAANYGEALFPLFSGKTLAGAPVAIPGTISHPGGSFHADHWFGELYDYARTKWAAYGPHRFDIAADMQDATHLAGGTNEAALIAIQGCRQGWRAMVASPQATMFLPQGIEPVTYVNGYDNGAGGWTDTPHPAGNTPDGTQRWARLTALAILRAAGLQSWPVPEFDNCQWDPTGAHVEVWCSAGPVTTTRHVRAEAALPPTFPHWTEVTGFQINGAPAAGAQIVGGRVRLTRPGGFAFGDVVTYGEGGATGHLQTPEDFTAGLWKNLPIVAVGAPGVEGIPVRPMPSAAVLANTLPAGTPTFHAGTGGPWFVDPVQLGSVSRLTVVWEGSFDTPATSSTPLMPTGGNLTLTILNSRKPRIYFKDSANTVFVNSAVLANALPTGALRLVLSVDLVAGYLRMWVNGTQEASFTIGANSGAIAVAARQISLLASSIGGSKATGTFTRMAVWKEATADGSDPASPVYHHIGGSLFAVNGDSWKQGSDAT